MIVKCLIGLTVLAVCVLAEDRFATRQRKCTGRITYRILKRDHSNRRNFIAYANTTGSSEQECVDKCFERSDFCSAVKLLPRENICLFSFKWLACKKGEELNPSTPSSSGQILHCIQCQGKSIDLKEKRQGDLLAVQRPVPSTRRQSVSTRRPTITTRKLRKFPTTGSLKTKTTRRPTSRRTSIDVTPATSKPPTVIQRKSTTAAATTTTTASTTSTTQKTTQRPTTAPIVNRTPLVDNSIANNISSLRPHCSIDMMKPCNYGFGRQCIMIESDECPICSCPYKSPSRGCAGPQGLSESHRKSMLLDREQCPDGNKVQIVHRWYRKVDALTRIDECVVIKEPYCGWLQDVNIWRMPRTEDECYYFCYNDDELILQGRTFFRL